MSSIFPLRDTVTRDKSREPRLVDLDEETADEVFEALSSQTTRKIFLELHHSPQTTSDLAEATDTSVQNVQYHLEKLTDADLVEVVDTWYSERGTEMKVYAPEDESLVLFAGRDKQRTLRNLLDRVVGVLGVLVPGSILAGLGAQWIPTDSNGGASDGEAPGGANGAESSGGANGEELGDAGANGAESGLDSAGDGGGVNVQGEDGALSGDEPAQGSDAFDMQASDGNLSVNDSVDSINVDYTLENTDNFTTNGTEPTDALLGLDTARFETAAQSATVENGTEAANLTVTDVDVTYELNETAVSQQTSSAPESGNATADLAPDNATNASDIGTEMVNNSTEAADAAASVDPTVAAAAGFFLGGLLIFLALTAWYGDW